MNKYWKILDDEKLIVSSNFIKILDKKNLNLIEFLVLIYIDNHKKEGLNINNIKELYDLEEKDILQALNSLTLKNLISIDTSNDEDGRINEIITLKKIYEDLIYKLEKDENKVKENNIFEVFEKEFARGLNPNEFELINGWISTGVSEELILGALKEAIYNGVRNFRYIDKIIYEWQKKGFKTMDDVDRHLTKRDESDSNNEELFDYNWLEDDE